MLVLTVTRKAWKWWSAARHITWPAFRRFGDTTNHGLQAPQCQRQAYRTRWYLMTHLETFRRHLQNWELRHNAAGSPFCQWLRMPRSAARRRRSQLRLPACKAVGFCLYDCMTAWLGPASALPTTRTAKQVHVANVPNPANCIDFLETGVHFTAIDLTRFAAEAFMSRNVSGTGTNRFLDRGRVGFWKQQHCTRINVPYLIYQQQQKTNNNPARRIETFSQSAPDPTPRESNHCLFVTVQDVMWIITACVSLKACNHKSSYFWDRE